MKGFFSRTRPAPFITLLAKTVCVLVLITMVGGVALAKTPLLSHIHTFFTPHAKQELASSPLHPSVLAAATQKLLGKVSFNIPAFFNDEVTFKKQVTFTDKTIFNNDLTAKGTNLDLGCGTITAANILSGITAGKGVSVTAGQSPVIDNTGVLSLQGKSGDVKLVAGTGITLDGLTITNKDPGSAQKIFNIIKAGSTSMTAGSNADTLTFVAGNNITITPDTATNKLTLSDTSAANLSTNGILYADTAASYVSLAPGTSGYILQSNGSGSAPKWVAPGTVNGTVVTFDAILSGTNTQAAMIVSTGASLNFSGSGTINASKLNGNTFAAPGAIGNTTAGTGAFTTLTETTINGLTITNNGSNTLNIAAGKSLIISNTLTLAGTDGTNFTLPSSSDTLVGRTSTDTLTNKTIAAGSNTISGLTNSNLSGSAGITNANLANSSVTVTAGTGLSGGGLVSLGGTVTINNAGVLSLTSTQATVSASTGNITISLPQNIDTNASPMFRGLTLSGLGTGIAHLNGNGLISSSAVSLNGADVTNTLGVGNGGTGIASLASGSLVYGAGSTTAFNTLAIGGNNTCLLSNGTAPTWGACALGTNYWQLNSGIISPLTQTNSLSIGTTGSLGTLDIRSLNGTQLTASISGATSFAGLVVDNSGTGDLFTASSSGKPRFIITQNGNVGIGGTSPLSVKLQVGTSANVTNPTAIYEAEFSNSKGTAQFIGNWASSGIWGIGPFSGNADNTVRIGNLTSSGSTNWNATQNINLVLGGG